MGNGTEQDGSGQKRSERRRDDEVELDERPSSGEHEDQEGRALSVIKTIEWSRTVRWGIVAASVVLGMLVLTWGYVQVHTEPQWWELLIQVLVTLLAPGGVIVVLLKSRKKFVDKHAAHTRELEEQIDPRRSSSGDPKQRKK